MRPDYHVLASILGQGTSAETRVNHSRIDNHCEGSSKSLKVSRENDGSIWYTCFRCGLSGRAYPSAVARREARRLRGEREDDEPAPGLEWKHTMPTGLTDPLQWSKPAREWLLSYLPFDVARSIEAVEFENRLWLPVHKDGEAVKWTGRRLYAEDRVKYLTGKIPKYAAHDPFMPCPQAAGTLVIVEDIVSAWSIATKLRLPAYPLMSVSLNVAQSSHLSRYAQLHRLGVVVWLDNDNPTVNKQARRLVRTLGGYGLDTHYERELQDPKTTLAAMPYSGYNGLVGRWR